MKALPLYSVQLIREKTVKYEPGEAGHSDAAVAALRGIIGAPDREIVVALFLNARHRIVGAHIITMGNGSHCSVDQQQVFRAAIVAGARAIVLGHNHPSGDATPSKEDLAFTKTVCASGNLLGIPVVDHIVIAEDSHHSMYQHGEIQ